MFTNNCPIHGKYIDEAMGCPECWRDENRQREKRDQEKKLQAKHPDHFAFQSEISSPKRTPDKF